MIEVTRIFLDVDGVLANWVGGVCDLFGYDEREVLSVWNGEWDINHQLDISTKELWSRIDAAGREFWARLKPYPWAFELFEVCRSAAPTTILTSPSLHHSSPAGKLLWLDEHFGRDQPFREYLIGPDKAACARPGAVLIDDSPHNCSEFNRLGGEGILFPRPWNANSHAVGKERGFIEDRFYELGLSYNLSLFDSEGDR